MPSRAWVVTLFIDYTNNHLAVSMPSRAWVVTDRNAALARNRKSFNALSGLSCYLSWRDKMRKQVMFQCPLGLELLRVGKSGGNPKMLFQCPLGLELLPELPHPFPLPSKVSMPSRAWVVTRTVRKPVPFARKCFNALSGLSCYTSKNHLSRSTFLFQCPLGLELLLDEFEMVTLQLSVSMPSRAWVVTLDIGYGFFLHVPFQCPLGLELLQGYAGKNQKSGMFQCPLGLELLRQECPIF